MKIFFLAIFAALYTFPALAVDTTAPVTDWLKPVEASKVCMVNNKAFDKDQIPVEVDGKTYYGCCPMCKDMLGKDVTKRMATDPISSKEVDKSTAVIGADLEGNVHYFENENNLKEFSTKHQPDRK